MASTILLLIRIAIAIIFLQTLYFKFTGHPDSVYIFTKVGLEPIGRIGIGILELIAAILLLMPNTVWMGAGLGFGLMCGAIFMHLTKLGIKVQDDNGSLFYLAILTFVLCSIVLWFYRKAIPFVSDLI